MEIFVNTNLLIVTDTTSPGIIGTLIMGNEHDKKLQIEGILHNNWTRFIAWQRDTSTRRSLAIPTGVADVFIPRRILERAHDPGQVHVHMLENTHDDMDLVIYEHRPEPVSDAEIFEVWLREGLRGSLSRN